MPKDCKDRSVSISYKCITLNSSTVGALVTELTRSPILITPACMSFIIGISFLRISDIS